MLRGIAQFSMQGRWQAASVVALLTLAAFILPPISYLASGVIVLTTLRMGPREGAIVMAASLVIFALLAALLLGKLWIAGLVLVAIWLPVYLVALVQGYTRSLATAFMASAGLGLLLVLLQHLLLADTSSWWMQFLSPLVETLSARPNWQLTQQETVDLVNSMAKLMAGFAAAGFSLNSIIGLIIGRAWQSQLFNEGAAFTEFTKLRLGKKAALLTILLMVLAFSPVQSSFSVLVDCFPVMVSLFAIQGLAVVHAIARERQKRKFWVVTTYILLVLMLPQMLVILATLGVVEQWFNFRKHSIE